jgi:hypothetical protein
MSTLESIIAAIAELPPEEVAQIREWLNERAEAEWDAQIEGGKRRHSELDNKYNVPLS